MLQSKQNSAVLTVLIGIQTLQSVLYDSKCEHCRHVCTKGAMHDGLKSPPRPTPRQMVLINGHWSVNKIQKSCWKFPRSSLKYDSASVIWWSELKMHGEQGQIKKLSLKNERRLWKRFPMMRQLKEECKILYSAIKIKEKFKWWI